MFPTTFFFYFLIVLNFQKKYLINKVNLINYILTNQIKTYFETKIINIKYKVNEVLKIWLF